VLPARDVLTPDALLVDVDPNEACSVQMQTDSRSDISFLLLMRMQILGQNLDY